MGANWRKLAATAARASRVPPSRQPHLPTATLATLLLAEGDRLPIAPKGHTSGAGWLTPRHYLVDAAAGDFN